MDNSFMQEGFNTLSPSLAIRNASSAIEWYKEVFGAVEKMRLTEPNGNIAHAELKIGDSIIMLAEESLEYNKSPLTLNGTSIVMNMYVKDVDMVVNKAISSGAKSIFPVKDQFYGDRSGRIEDPFGHQWIISTAFKKVSAEEMQRLMDEMMRGS